MKDHATPKGPRTVRSLHALALRFRRVARDYAIWLLAAPVAYLLRFDGTIPLHHRDAMWFYVAVGAVLKLVAVVVFRLTATSYRKVTFGDLGLLVAAVSSVVLMSLLAAALAWPTIVVPRSVPLIEGAIALLALFGARALGRRWAERRRGADAEAPKSVVVIGAGEAGSLLAREMQRHPETGLKVIGFIDDDPQKRGLRISGVPVLGNRDELPRVLRSMPVDEVLIATPSADGRFVREALHQVRLAADASNRHIETRVMPGVFELLSGDVSIERLREVRVEDLLRRPPVQLDSSAIASVLNDRTVLVTGAGGSIGSEIVRQVLAFRPARLVLLGRGENSLVTIERELQALGVHVPCHLVLASITDAERTLDALERYRPQVVFHAAAHKHVPILEEHPEEAVSNNVLGTLNLVQAALAVGVERFVNISTDKAVRPTSVLGASKRVAEWIVKDAARRAGPHQSFVSVRFGNVLGSRGSVVPLFRAQIEAGGPVTITDQRMMRFFMTVPEAAQLVLQAASLATNGDVYYLDMGEPVRILDLAEDLIRLSGMEPHVDIEVREVGIRPGEKLFEELVTESEEAGRTVHPKILVASDAGVAPEHLDGIIERLRELASASDRLAIAALFDENVPGSTIRVGTSVPA